MQTNPETVNATVTTLTTETARDAESVEPSTEALESRRASAAEPAEKPETPTTRAGTEKLISATDLTDGNKVVPGQVATTSGVHDESDDAPNELTDVTGDTDNDVDADDTDNDLDSGDSDAPADAASAGAQQAAA